MAWVPRESLGTNRHLHLLHLRLLEKGSQLKGHPARLRPLGLKFKATALQFCRRGWGFRGLPAPCRRQWVPRPQVQRGF